MEFKQAQLDNGLTVIAERMGRARSTALGFFVRTGSRDEEPAAAGVSHYLEHMMFKGTEKRSALAVNLEFDAMGAKYNAFTSEENTVYYAAVLPEFQGRVLELWADLLRPALRDEDFEMEKQVILEEIAMYQDLPHYDVMDRCRRLHFGRHRCGNSVLGSTESITVLRAEQMRAYFEQRYAPDNMVLACAGQVDWDELVRQAGQLCGGWRPAGPSRQLSDFHGTGGQEMVLKDKVVREHICLMTAAPSAQSPLRYAAGVLGNIIGDDTNSRLYWLLVDTALADAAEMEYEGMDQTGAFYIYLSCDPVQTEKVLQIVRDELVRVRQEGVSETELEASRNKIASALTLNGELPMGRLAPLGLGWTYRGKYRSMAEDLAAVQAVSREDVQKLLSDYPLEQVTTLGLGPR